MNKGNRTASMGPPWCCRSLITFVSKQPTYPFLLCHDLQWPPSGFLFMNTAEIRCLQHPELSHWATPNYCTVCSLLLVSVQVPPEWQIQEINSCFVFQKAFSNADKEQENVRWKIIFLQKWATLARTINFTCNCWEWQLSRTISSWVNSSWKNLRGQRLSMLDNWFDTFWIFLMLFANPYSYQKIT